MREYFLSLSLLVRVMLATIILFVLLFMLFITRIRSCRSLILLHYLTLTPLSLFS
jgi:hypothetical protein